MTEIDEKWRIQEVKSTKFTILTQRQKVKKIALLRFLVICYNNFAKNEFGSRSDIAYFMESLQPYDIIILILLGVLTLRGFFKGAASQVATLVALIVTWWAAVKFSPVVTPMIKADPPWNKIVAIFLIFIAVYIAVRILHRMIAGMITRFRMKSFDRLFGAIFGLLEGIVLGMVVTFFAVTLTTFTCEKALQSKSGVILARFVEKIAKIFPEDVNQLVKKNLEAFQTTMAQQKANAGSDAPINTPSKSEALISGLLHKSSMVSDLNTSYKSLVDPASQPPTLPAQTSTVSQEKDTGSGLFTRLLQTTNNKPIQEPPELKNNAIAENPPVTIAEKPGPEKLVSSPQMENTASDRKRWLELILSE